MSKSLVLAAVLAMAAAGGAWLYTGQKATDQSPVSISATPQEATTSSVASRVPDMILGEVSAPVTVMEYASYTCPHCQNFHATVFEQFKTNYIDTGKVKFVYREVYFDKFGLWAAMVARCGGPEKYFGISDILYDTQKDWLASGEDAGISDALRKIGLKSGLTPEALDACLNDNDMAKAMVEVYQANATADMIEGTPTLIINGEKFGNMSYEELAKILDEKLAN